MSEAAAMNASGPATPSSGVHEDRIEKLGPVFYIRWTRGPNYERAFLCVEDGEPDMCEFATVSYGQAEIFKAGWLASEMVERERRS